MPYQPYTNVNLVAHHIQRHDPYSSKAFSESYREEERTKRKYAESVVKAKKMATTPAIFLCIAQRLR